MWTQHTLTNLVVFFPIQNVAQVLRTSGWLESWLICPEEEEEEESQKQLDLHLKQVQVEERRLTAEV